MNQLIAQKIRDFSLDLYEPLVPRDLSLGLPAKPRAGNLVTVVVGMRRCGKTYRLFQEIKALLNQGVSPHQILYFNFEDDRFAPLTPSLGDEVIDTFYEMNPQLYQEGAYFFLDEIQKMDNWGVWLRRIVDTRKVTIYATGSSSKLLSADVATEFRGRSLTYEMLPYSFSEYTHLHAPELKSGSSAYGSEEIARFKQLFSRYLQQGGFPGVQGESGERLLGILQSYAQRAVAQDVIERHNLSNPQAVSLFAQRVLSLNGRELSLRKIENDFRSQGTSVTRAALGEALSYFEDAFLLACVRKFSRAFADNARSVSKVYAIDPGLAWANSLSSSQDISQRLEGIVYLELRRRSNIARKGTIATLRTQAHNYEVDFIVGDALSQRGFDVYQVSVSVKDPKTRQREMRALREAMAEKQLARGYLLTMEGDEEDVVVSEGIIHVVPVWKWCLAKGRSLHDAILH
ncbi:MAG: ATP-binding protein [Raoultibacter sp.]